MNTYTKPNVLLPVSLHDAKVTRIIVQPPTQNLIDGQVTFEFADGYYKVDEVNSYQTKKASITISGIDYDFSHVYYCKNNSRHEVEFSQLAEDVQKHALEIIDEAYGYNQTRLSCYLYLEDDCYDVEIEVYHFNETVYHWEE